ncbi:MAG: hypothetical protein GPJ52_02780 [Candidatus Heimdallarchaeota archaeon]|nr:hypothetical protein [Candidatus Heimdallarchaeota archaeon]
MSRTKYSTKGNWETARYYCKKCNRVIIIEIDSTREELKRLVSSKRICSVCKPPPKKSYPRYYINRLDRKAFKEKLIQKD